MSSSERNLEATLAKSGEDHLEAELATSGQRHQPPYAWQEQVWRKLEEPYVEAQAPKRGSFALWGYATLTTLVLLVGVGGMMLKTQRDAADSEERDRKAVGAEVQRMKSSIQVTDALIDRAQAHIDSAFTDLEAAKDAESKQRAIAARDQAKVALRNARERRSRQQSAMARQAKAKKVRAKKKEKALISKCAKSVDPLCGL